MAVVLADSSAVIAFLDRRDPHHSAAHDAFTALASEGADLVVSAITYAECLVRPLRSGGDALRTVERFFSSYPTLAIEPVSPDIARSAAALRAKHLTSSRS